MSRPDGLTSPESDAGPRAVDAWMDAVAGASTWVAPLRESASALGARAVLITWFDPAQGGVALEAAPETTPSFVEFCRSATPAAHDELTERDELGLGRVTYLRVRLRGEPNGWLVLFSLSEDHADPTLFQEIATAAACSVAARARLSDGCSMSALKTAAFDHLPFGVVIVDRDIKVAECNEACRALAARAEGLGVRDDTLFCHDHLDQAALAKEVGRALSGDSSSAVVNVHRPRGAQPLVVRVVAPRGNADPNHCLLTIVDPDEELSPGCDIWRIMFDLTESELVIAEGLVSGRRINDIASQRGVSIETVRSQSKRMFERLL